MSLLLDWLEWLLTVALPTLLVIGFLQYAHETRGDVILRRLANGVAFVLNLAILLKAALTVREYLPDDPRFGLLLQIGLPLALGLLGMIVGRLVKALGTRLAKAQVST
ncbi:hypothetical protein [Glacieibacterium frigidum]|uniref:Uncharacterized protein n=1 Tax=Glacieibacterium frigidum TaxID=2593303 RepID=A0A552UH59_9SPHN|nr:hypothetical protein [Glacieibacterium frigidum]TRW17563.1 hypothetical protein FMM06_05265 [Glacieibacterium frigidum]